ncbi:GCN5-like N-acetyltransferase [Hypoxylon fragiforme]|uniref:GCN5-like N-acetyltransferase n=1 Tax=Hypoxylon fragiforme TaxID=63214 RepID=UPI0020C668EA|nr:GCN5-like N-acetyltransferase [Hypoxylon fragiforme]KAI2610062.1 GCN5-like N-acetyltransferase [Hypoxylon fragiforme]
MEPCHTVSCSSERHPITIRSIPAADTYALRHAVLWPNKPLSYVQLPDDIAGQHFGAFISAPRLTTVAEKSKDSEDSEDNHNHSHNTTGYNKDANSEDLVSIISLFVNDDGDDDSGTARFRKFATAPAWQGRGVGSALLNYTIETAARNGATSIWCDARQSALPFYQRFGMSGEGEVFFKGELPYLRMSRALP